MRVLTQFGLSNRNPICLKLTLKVKFVKDPSPHSSITICIHILNYLVPKWSISNVIATPSALQYFSSIYKGEIFCFFESTIKSLEKKINLSYLFSYHYLEKLGRRHSYWRKKQQSVVIGKRVWVHEPSILYRPWSVWMMQKSSAFRR